MAGWNFSTATDATDWSAVTFIQQFWKAVNERNRARGAATVLMPGLGSDVQKSTSTATTKTITGITRSGSTATATTSAAHGFVAGDTICIANVAQRQYDGYQTVDSAPTSTTFTYTVTGTPDTPATVISGSITVALLSDIAASVSAIQTALQTMSTSFVAPATDVTGLAKAASITFSLTTWRTAAGINSSGFRRKKPREILNATALTDREGNARAEGQKAWGSDPADANRGWVYRYKAADGVWYATEDAKTITSLTRVGTTATATVAAHGYVTGDTIRIDGADPSGYNKDTGITVTGTNTFTYEVTGSLTTPATPAFATITAARLYQNPDVLDSDLSAPNNVPYGTLQTGDYIGPWLFNELKAGFNQLVKQEKSLSAVNSVRKKSDGSEPTYADAVAEAQATFAVGSDALNSGIVSICIASHPDGSPYTINARVHEAKLQASGFAVQQPSCEIDFYVWAETYGPSASGPSIVNIAPTYDDQGLGYTQDAYTLVDTVGREGDTATTTETTAVTVGTAAFPNDPGDPGSIAGKTVEHSHGYQLASLRAFLRWDVADGFEFY